jgi:hypothetical protein
MVYWVGLGILRTRKHEKMDIKLNRVWYVQTMIKEKEKKKN